MICLPNPKATAQYLLVTIIHATSDLSRYCLKTSSLFMCYFWKAVNPKIFNISKNAQFILKNPSYMLNNQKCIVFELSVTRYFSQPKSIEKQHVTILSGLLPLATHDSHPTYIFSESSSY